MRVLFSPEELVNVADEVGCDHDLEDVGGQVMVQEQGSIVEKEGPEVEEIPAEQNLSPGQKFLPKFCKISSGWML